VDIRRGAAVITLAWWVFVGALALAALVGGMCIALLFAWVDDPARTPLMDDGSWEDDRDEDN
jgi:hypothetical protein